MGHVHGGPAKAGTYLLTEDLVDKIEPFHHDGILTPGHHSDVYAELQDRLATALQNALPDGQIVRRQKMHKLATRVIGFIDGEWADEDVLVVSTCPELTYPARGESLQINRLVNSYGVEIGIGPRPGRPPLAYQFHALKKAAKGRRIVIAEDGVFSGNTMGFISNALDENELELAGMVTGYYFSDKPNNTVVRDGVKFFVVHDEIDDLIDWVPDHDFLPFTPGCGLVLGTRIGGHVQPLYDHNGASFSVPYVAPFGKVSKWASIPEGNVETFSKECMAIARDLYVTLDKLNKKQRGPLTVSDVAHASSQRISIPVQILPMEGQEGHDPDRKIKLLPSEVGIVELLDSYLD